MPMRRRTKGLSTDEIRTLTADEMDLPLTNEDFQEALSKISSSVSAAQLLQYEKWRAEFGSE